MSNIKIIIFSFILIIFTSFVYLSYTETKQAQFSGWWSLSFVDPKNFSLDFAVENYTDHKNFHYAVLEGENKIIEKDIVVEKNVKKEIKINQEIEKKEGAKITIQVTNGNESKEIYKQ